MTFAQFDDIWKMICCVYTGYKFGGWIAEKVITRMAKKND